MRVPVFVTRREWVDIDTEDIVLAEEPLTDEISNRAKERLKNFGSTPTPFVAKVEVDWSTFLKVK